MDEIDHMYDDMQDRLFEIDKNRYVKYNAPISNLAWSVTCKQKMYAL